MTNEEAKKKAEVLASGIFDYMTKELNIKVGDDYDPDFMRRVIGLALSSMHRLMISDAKGEEQQRRAVEKCFSSVTTLIDCLKAAIDDAGVEGVEIIAMELPNSPSAPATNESMQ